MPIQGGTATVANTTLIQAFGQDGNDTIALDETNGALPNAALFGGNGTDTLIGGSGNDLVVGGTGNDLALLGAGNDTFFWNPGDGSDIVEGGADLDRLDFVGANINEVFDISANGARVRFSRDVGNVTMDVNDVERIDVHALGGADTVVINDLTGTDLPLAGVAVDLEGALGTGVGDGQVDQVIVNGTAGNDAINLLSINGGAGILITGSPAPVAIFHSEAGDQLTINGGAGGDLIDASGLNAGQIGLTLNLGAGGDAFFGSQGNDVVNGGTGNDAGFLGAGNDLFIWNPGDGSDTVEGGSGIDTLQFNGANIAEIFDISANGEGVRFTRDIGNVTMNVNDVELVDLHALGGADTIVVNDLTGTDLALAGVKIDLEGALGSGVADGASDSVTVNGGTGSEAINVSSFNGGVLVSGTPAAVGIFHADATDQLIIRALGGADTITVNDLSGTGVSNVRIDLSATGGGGDGQVDTIVINATNGDDVVVVSNNNGVVTVSGLAAQVTISGFEATDRLVINGVAGDDVIDASGLGTAMLFTADGGDGDDVLIGSDGPDTLLGGAGDDVLLGGLGLDVLDGGPGDNVVIQGISASLDHFIL